MVVVTDGSILLLKCDYLLKNSDMGTRSALWSFANKFFTCGVIGVYVSDRFVGVAPVRGSSMSPTLNPGTTSLMGLPVGLYIERSQTNCCSVHCDGAYLVVWLQMTMFWWRNGVFKTTSFHMVTWLFSGNFCPQCRSNTIYAW